MTSIFKRGGRPGYTLSWVEDDRKRQRQFRTKRAAEEHRDHLRARLRAQAGLGLDLPLSTYAKVWLERVQQSARPATHEQYEWAMRHHVLPALGGLSLRQLTRAHVKTFLSGKLEERLDPGSPRYQEPEPGGEPPRRLARTTVSHLRTALHGCLEEAVDDQLLASNPAALRRRSRTLRLAATRAERRAKVKAFSTEQLAAFRAAAQAVAGTRALLFRLLAATGLRPGEGLGLKWGDMDLVGRSAHVCRTWSGGREGATKSGFERDVDLSHRLAEELRAHDAATKAPALARGRERPPWCSRTRPASRWTTGRSCGSSSACSGPPASRGTSPRTPSGTPTPAGCCSEARASTTCSASHHHPHGRPLRGLAAGRQPRQRGRRGRRALQDRAHGRSRKSHLAVTSARKVRAMMRSRCTSNQALSSL